jgi:hypothetical protein
MSHASVPRTIAITGAVALGALAFGALSAGRDDSAWAAPRVSASGAAGIYASAAPSTLPPDEEPTPVAPGERPRHLPKLDGPPVPEEPSPKPTKQDWLGAPNADDVRITDPSCKAQRIREWYRVACGDEHVSVVSGKKTDLDIDRSDPAGAAVIFPARRGDVRLLTFAYFFKWGLVQDAVLSVQWLDGDPRPLITVLGVPHGGL